MADTNQQPSSPNSPQKPQQDAQKPGLSWSQPAAGTQQNATQGKPTLVSVPTTDDSSGRVIGIIVGIVVVFALAAWGIAALHNRSTGSPAAMSTSSETSTMATSGSAAMTEESSTTVAETSGSSTAAAPVVSGANNTFSAPSPQDAGTAIAINSMSLSAPTWIIVYESHNGVPGNILGAGLFFPGDTSGNVQLLRATTSGQTYLVTAAVDNGDKLFSIKDEKPVMDSSGKQVWITVQTR